MERIIDKVKVTKSYIGKSEMTSGNAYRVTMAYNGKRVWFVFNDNYLNNSNKEELIKCLLGDSYAYEYNNNLYDFLLEFGYSDEEYDDGKAAFYGCKKQSERLHKLFTKKEVEFLEKELETA